MAPGGRVGLRAFTASWFFALLSFARASGMAGASDRAAGCSWGFAPLGSAKWVLESQLWIACVLSWFGLTDGAMGAKEWKLGFAYTVRAHYGPVLTSSDVYGVVVMVSRPSAVLKKKSLRKPNI